MYLSLAASSTSCFLLWLLNQWRDKLPTLRPLRGQIQTLATSGTPMWPKIVFIVVSFSGFVIEHWPQATWGEKDLFHFNFTVLPGKQRQLWQELGARNWSRDHQVCLLPYFSLSCSACPNKSDLIPTTTKYSFSVSLLINPSCFYMQFLWLILHFHYIILSWCFARTYSPNWKGPKKNQYFHIPLSFQNKFCLFTC